MSTDAQNIQDEIIERELKEVRKKLSEMAQTREHACAITKVDEAMHWLAAGRESRNEHRLNAIKEIANGRDSRF